MRSYNTANFVVLRCKPHFVSNDLCNKIFHPSKLFSDSARDCVAASVDVKNFCPQNSHL